MHSVDRRRFLRYLAASPVLAHTYGVSTEESLDAIDLPDFLIDRPEQALDVFDFHDVAKARLPTAHYGYLATGTDGNETLVANREAFRNIYLRMMRMVDTSSVDLSTVLLDEALRFPIVLAPVSSQRAFHPDAELASRRT